MFALVISGLESIDENSNCRNGNFSSCGSFSLILCRITSIATTCEWSIRKRPKNYSTKPFWLKKIDPSIDWRISIPRKNSASAILIANLDSRKFKTTFMFSMLVPQTMPSSTLKTKQCSAVHEKYMSRVCFLHIQIPGKLFIPTPPSNRLSRRIHCLNDGFQVENCKKLE